MIYSVNGETRDTAPISVSELVAELTGSAATVGVAVAVNETVIPRSGWDRTIQDGDVVDVLTAVQGG